MAELLILGTSGLAKEMAHLARAVDPAAERWPVISYVTHDPAELGKPLLHGTVRWLDADLLARTEPADVVVGVGQPALRRKLVDALQGRANLSFPNLVHPSVPVAASVRLGRGNAITQGVALTCDIEIGDFNLLNLNSTVGHDGRIGSFNVVNPGCNVSGWVTMGSECLLGTGSQVLERLTLASGTVLGAGGVLTRNTEAPGTWVGVPAKALAPRA
jgi:sugar O-acyltransferase (sialic acid O-acetyltransferase NeuD family)